MQPNGCMIYDMQPRGCMSSWRRTPSSAPRTDIREDQWGDEVAHLILDPAMLDPDATVGLDEFSHLEVVFWFQPSGPVREPAWMHELMREYY
jgi:tRNA (Thr-GGU) A37 N-methylase